MNVAHAVEVFLLDPESAAYLAIVVHPVPERPVMSLKIVAAPGAPALEFALRSHMQVRAIEECSFGQVVHVIEALV